MSDNFVDPDEILYRRILAGRKLYNYLPDGTIKISSMAFTDQEFKISVDRAKLCTNDPRYTLGYELGGVVSLVTRDIQDITDLTRNNQKGETIEQFKIDVEPDPLPNNDAHAVIFATPEFTKADKQAAFKRLCKRLARLAGERQWEILPPRDRE